MPSHFYALSIFKPVLCVGCLSIDLLSLCYNLPEKFKHEVCLKAEWRRGGHSSNVSVVLRMLGSQVEFLAVLSRSSFMNGIIKEMEGLGIHLRHCPRTDNDPAYSTIITSKKTGSRAIMHCNNNFPYVTFEDFKKLDLKNYGWVHLEASNILETIKMIRSILDYNNGLRDTERIRISIRVDECYIQSTDLFNMCDYVLFSRQLAMELGWKTPKETCLELNNALKLPRSIHFRRPCFICSWGTVGAGCLDPLGNYTVQPACPPKFPVDSYRVGECFTAAFIYASYVREMTLANAVQFANRVAGFKVSGNGYNHLLTLNTYPSTVVDEDHSLKATKNDEVQDLICQKYLKREVNYSDGTLSTKLLGRDPDSNIEPLEDQGQTKVGQTLEDNSRTDNIQYNRSIVKIRKISK